MARVDSTKLWIACLTHVLQHSNFVPLRLQCRPPNQIIKHRAALWRPMPYRIQSFKILEKTIGQVTNAFMRGGVCGWFLEDLESLNSAWCRSSKSSLAFDVLIDGGIAPGNGIRFECCRTRARHGIHGLEKPTLAMNIYTYNDIVPIWLFSLLPFLVLHWPALAVWFSIKYQCCFIVQIPSPKVKRSVSNRSVTWAF